MSMCCFDCHDYMDGYNRGKKEGSIEELENLKSEIELMDFDFGDYYDDTNIIIEMVSKVIDKRIAELKGENKCKEH